MADITPVEMNVHANSIYRLDGNAQDENGNLLEVRDLVISPEENDLFVSQNDDDTKDDSELLGTKNVEVGTKGTVEITANGIGEDGEANEDRYKGILNGTAVGDDVPLSQLFFTLTKVEA